MKMFINLPLTLLTLYLFIGFGPPVNASKRPWTKADYSGAAKRRARAVNRPVPIDCRLGTWSYWTPCTSCTAKKFRFRHLEKASQFDGTRCGDLQEDLVCPTATTQCLVPDYCGESSFTCKETGRCISQSLQCNGEPDCFDFSDEEDCEAVNQRDDKCSKLLPIPGAERGTQGVDVLSGEFVDHVIDPMYFGGECEYVYNGEWRKFGYDAFCENLHYNEDEKNYRKPYNYHSYRFVAEARSEGSQEYYEDMTKMLKARKEMSSSSGGATVGVYYVEVGLTGSSESEFLENITQHRSEDLGFVRLWSKVQTAQFKMRTNKVMLHEDFYFSLMELPEQYDFGMYSRFFKTFGTHYVTEGVMGGTLEFVLVVNKTSMARSKITAEQVGSCFGGNFGISYPLSTSVTAGLKLRGKSCGKGGDYNEVNKANKSVIEDVLTQVKGGILESTSGVFALRNANTYKKWGASLKYNPVVIEYETMPIYELVRLSTAADHVGARLANLRRGLEEYLQEFDPCHCTPCRHNGLPVLKGTTCKCICKSGYRGEACQETNRRDTKIDGSWSCWGVWSSCASGSKTRTRTCNNPAPNGGGVTCLGSPFQTQHC